MPYISTLGHLNLHTETTTLEIRPRHGRITVYNPTNPPSVNKNYLIKTKMMTASQLA